MELDKLNFNCRHNRRNLGLLCSGLQIVPQSCDNASVETRFRPKQRRLASTAWRHTRLFSFSRKRPTSVCRMASVWCVCLSNNRCSPGIPGALLSRGVNASDEKNLISLQLQTWVAQRPENIRLCKGRHKSDRKLFSCLCNVWV